jgi:hypothetical protein
MNFMEWLGKEASIHQELFFSFKDATVGINEPALNFEGIKLFPNPNNGWFIIQSSVNSQPDSHRELVEIYNMLGEKVYSEFSTFNSPVSINISNQPVGIYLYRVITEDGNLVAVGKFVIQ